MADRFRGRRRATERWVAVGEPAVGPGPRATAALGIVLLGYSYLVGLWSSRHGYAPRELVAVREWLNGPLGLGEDFGYLGAGLLLVVAGHLLAAAALGRREAARRPGRLVLGLLLRAYPLFVVAVTVSAAVLAVGGEPLTAPADPAVSPSGYLAGVLLADQVVGQPALLGLGWVPAVAALFAVLLLVAGLPLRRWPLLAVLVQVEVAGLLVLAGAWADQAGAAEPVRALGVLAGHLPLTLLGEVVWLRRAGRLGDVAAALTGLAALAVAVAAEDRFVEQANWWHPLGVLYAGLLAAVLLPRCERVGDALLVRWLASRAYPLFLAVGVVGYPLLTVQDQRVPLLVALPVAVLATGVAAEAAHRWVVLPGVRAGRRLVAPPPRPVVEPAERLPAEAA